MPASTLCCLFCGEERSYVILSHCRLQYGLLVWRCTTQSNLSRLEVLEREPDNVLLEHQPVTKLKAEEQCFRFWPSDRFPWTFEERSISDLTQKLRLHEQGHIRQGFLTPLISMFRCSVFFPTFLPCTIRGAEVTSYFMHPYYMVDMFLHLRCICCAVTA